ncbi:MAG: hypothetical protein AAGB22_13925, partial [Bacteroidota bacterium]
EVETPRSDAGVGTVLQNSGSGTFRAVPLNTSGFLADRDVKQLKKIQLEDGRTGILIARNDDQLSLLILSSGSLSSL